MRQCHCFLYFWKAILTYLMWIDLTGCAILLLLALCVTFSKTAGYSRQWPLCDAFQNAYIWGYIGDNHNKRWLFLFIFVERQSHALYGNGLLKHCSDEWAFAINTCIPFNNCLVYSNTTFFVMCGFLPITQLLYGFAGREGSDIS